MKFIGTGAATLAIGAMLTVGTVALAQSSTQGSAPAPNQERPVLGPPIYKLDDQTMLRWALPPSAMQYGKIDGFKLKPHVDALIGISEKSKKDGNQWWGRITATPYNVEAQDYVEGQFKKYGLQTRRQTFDLPPVWWPDSWQITASVGGQAITLKTAQPTFRSPGTSDQGITGEAVYVGLGSVAETRNLDLRGKVVFVYDEPEPSAIRHLAGSDGTMKRLQESGAAALVLIFALPGNATVQLWGTHGESQVRDPIPTFAVGLEDGMAVRRMIESTKSPVSVHVAMKVETRTGLKPQAVWATLPGLTDENIMVEAHTDAFFQGGNDNAGGVAVMLGLAEYFASVPKDHRRRTITFFTTVGHHVSNDVGLVWIRDNMKDFLGKTALIINAEHPVTTQVYHFNGALVRSNAATAHRFSISGSTKIKDIFFNDFSLFGVGLYEAPQIRPLGDSHLFYDIVPTIEVIKSNEFYHTDLDINTIPAVGIEGMTRAYAKIIDDVNQLELSDLKSGEMRSGKP